MTCVATGTYAYQFKSGHIGSPAGCAEIRLVAIPSMPHYKISDTKHGDLEIRYVCLYLLLYYFSLW
jgi:hypothetical protein